MKFEIRNLKSEGSPKDRTRSGRRTVAPVLRAPSKPIFRHSDFGIRILDFHWLGFLALLVLLQACRTDERSPRATASGAKSDEAASRAAFRAVYPVFMHPRCMNCHPAGDVPLQGDDSHPHLQNVKRGPDGKGL